MHRPNAIRGSRGVFRGLVVTVIVLATLIVVWPGTPTQAAPPAEQAWGDGAVWEVVMPGGQTTVKGKTPKPFYLIAPIDASSPQSSRFGLGPHDNVVHVPPFPPHARGGLCRVLLVVPGPQGVPAVNIEVVPDPDLDIPYVRSADVDGDGTMEPLTSAGLIEAAAAAGLVSMFEPRPGGEPIAFHCPVRPYRG